VEDRNPATVLDFADSDHVVIVTGKIVTLAGAGLSGADAGNYVLDSVATTTADIYALHITGSFTASNKIYDATTAATITGRTLSGVLGTDVVSYVGGTANFSDKNIGNGKIVTATGLGLSGTDAGNYTVNTTATTTANITPRAITGSITAANKVYDGNTAATILTRTLGGVIAGDVVSYVGGTASFADPYVGTGKTVTATGLSLFGTDAGNYTVNATATTTANVTPYSATGTVTLSNSPWQYSDQEIFTAKLSPASIGGQSPAGYVTFSIGTQTIGTVQLQNTSGVLTGTLAYPLAQAPGSYTVKAVFSTTSIPGSGVNPNFTVGTPTTPLTVTREDARAYYAGLTFVSTSSLTSGTATVTLSATIKDITAVTGDPAYDANAGDIRKATVTFINRDTNTAIATVPVGLVSAGDTKTGTATYNWPVNIGTANSQSYTIGIIVNNYYTRNSSEDNTVVTVSKPLGEFITGGGFIVNLASSAGMLASEPGLKTNYGFNVKYNKSDTNLQGNVNIIVRSYRLPNGTRDTKLHIYQIKSTAILSLSVRKATATTPGTAQFAAKANIQDITNPAVPISVDGGVTLQMTVTDKGEPGAFDSIGFTVLNKSGGLYYSNNWTGVKTIEQLLGGGNLKVL